MQQHYGMGSTIEEAFADAVKNKRSQLEGVGEVFERPKGKRADELVALFDGDTGKHWFAMPAAYIEAHGYKKETKRAGQRGSVWLFFRTEPKRKRNGNGPKTAGLQDLLP